MNVVFVVDSEEQLTNGIAWCKKLVRTGARSLSVIVLSLTVLTDREHLDAVIGAAFEVGFGRDGLGVLPWVEGNLIICPGGMVSKSRASHRCRFVSVDDCWIWDCSMLLREDKRSSPGTDEGFRAIALLPLVDGLGLDVVSGRARQGQHSVEHIVSYQVRSGELVEVSQRTVNANHGGRQI